MDEYDGCGGGAGAALALEVARTDERVRKVVLSRPMCPDESERDDYIEHYAPAIEARWDGTHFLTAWHMLRDRAFFWPWYRRTREAIRRIEPQVDPNRLQLRLTEWLKGRLTYGDYVRACLAVEPAAYGAVKQPVLIMTTPGDRLEADATRLAACVDQAVQKPRGGLAETAQTMRAFLDAP